jgi:hypothetical protein
MNIKFSLLADRPNTDQSTIDLKMKKHENLKSIMSGLYSVSVFVDIERQIPPQCSPCDEVSIGINADAGGI